jgi:hypothetical protein
MRDFRDRQCTLFIPAGGRFRLLTVKDDWTPPLLDAIRRYRRVRPNRVSFSIILR